MSVKKPAQTAKRVQDWRANREPPGRDGLQRSGAAPAQGRLPLGTTVNKYPPALPVDIYYVLGLGLQMRATRKPKKMAAVIPPAAAVEPPVRAPMRPS